MYLKTTDSGSAVLSLGSNKDLMLLSLNWTMFFLLDWRFLSSQGEFEASQKCLCFSSSAVFFFSFYPPENK